MNGSTSSRSPWWWVPSLYFAEGIPYFLVNNISVTMFTRMGVPNGEMALFTSLIYLPWMIKPFWSPFVDIIRTKRWWIVAMQILMSVAFILLTLSIPHPATTLIAEKQVPVSLFTLTLIFFVLTAFASATHDIAADGFYMLANDKEQQSFFIGIRSTAYRISSVFCQGILVFIAGLLEKDSGDIPTAWQITVGIAAAVFCAVTLWHYFALPQSSADTERTAGTDGQGTAAPTAGTSDASRILREFGRTFATFFAKPGALLAIAFMLLYRLPEAFLIKMINPFLLDPASHGGLGLATEEVGLVYGTMGVIALTAGGILGGIAASRWGLRKSLWPMAACMTLPCLTVLYLSIFQPSSIVTITVCVAIEQFGYGFGFTAYMLYMMYFSEGEFTTAHYAICTGFMALSMMLPGMVAGYLQEAVGYEGFFIIVMVCCLATLAVTRLAQKHVDADYGKK